MDLRSQECAVDLMDRWRGLFNPNRCRKRALGKSETRQVLAQVGR